MINRAFRFFAADTTGDPARYWFETRRPLCNLAFLLPWLVIYECGVVWLGGARADAFRNGADFWMRTWLRYTGVVGLWVLPVMVMGVLLAWHLYARLEWRLSWKTLLGMASESLLFALLLVLFGQGLEALCRSAPPAETLMQWDSHWTVQGISIRVVTFLGAGIYEEFLFRLCLVPAAYLGLRTLLVPERWAIGGTIVLTSLVFSLAHYIGPAADEATLSMLTSAVARVQASQELRLSFLFRTVAGMVFAALFCLRGFGVTVGCHATYDIIVGVLLHTEL